jgi:tRNA-Thr(GGU) m(6)t(6)A37 methyltransferase TsaA
MFAFVQRCVILFVRWHESCADGCARAGGPGSDRAGKRGFQRTADLRGFGEPAMPARAGADGLLWAALWAVPAAGGQTVLVQTSYGLMPIGWVQSALRVLEDAPNQREGAPGAWIRFDEQVAEGAKDLRPGDEIVVLTWLHLSSRDELSTHPQGDMSQPLTGVFSTCSPNRPNPIGLHRARIVAREGLRIEVDALEAIDGTPVVDVKPAIDPPA